MDREGLDLNGLSKSFIRNSVLISHSGVDSSFSVYQHALTSHFSRNPTIWKRNGKPFPHMLTFPLKFVPFEDSLCFGPQISPTEVNKIAFLHIFNVNVTSADDYRSTVRHNVSDWFAKLNAKPDIQWMIVVNTTRAKDKKTRSAIMDKIKADFSKYHSRLYELPDTTDQQAFTSFVQGIQQCLFSHLNLIMEIWDRALKSGFERRKQHTWDPFAYFISMTEYGRSYWSYGAVEFSISIFDDLEQLLHEFVLRASEQDSPRWLAQIMNTKIEDRPSLVKNFGVQQLAKKDGHYMGMRNYLLCQQIVMSIHLFQHKMKSNDAAPSLRSDCAIEILRRTLNCIESIREFNIQMNNKRDIAKTCCWTIWTISESLLICSVLCDISHLNIVPSLLAKLQLAKFEALHTLAKHIKLNPEDAEELTQWLKINESLESRILTSALKSNENMAQELEKAHDVCVNAMNHSNKHRISINVTYKLFAYLRSVNAKCAISKISINKNVLKTMPIQETTGIMIKSLCEEYLEQSACTEELLSILLFISQCENGTDHKINQLFINKCEEYAKNHEKKHLKWSSISDKQVLSVKIFEFESLQTTDSILNIRCNVHLNLGFKLEKSKLRLKFSSKSGSNVVKNEDLSVLSLQFDPKENTCRLLSHQNTKKSTEKLVESPYFEVFSSEVDLVPGDNIIELTTDISKIGCFVLEKVSITSESEILYYETKNLETRVPAVLYCIPTPHSVTVVDNSHPFLAGVLQKIDVDVEAGCDIDKDTDMMIAAQTEVFQFLNLTSMNWQKSMQITIPPLKNGEKTRISVYIWLKIDATNCESAAMQKRSIFVDWMSRKYTLTLNFVPTMVITSKTSMLQTDILLEVEVNRVCGPNITTILQNGTLETGGNLETGKNLNHFPINCNLLSISNIVFKLPRNGACVSHKLHLDYTVRDGSMLETQKEGIEQLMYTFDDVVELTVPEIRFELCTQVLSQQPGAQLCRATNPCHYVISIRSLKEMACTLFVVLNADDRMWTLAERTKMVNVKDSGLGQLALSIIPVVAGYLPFPSVSIYECQHTNGHHDVALPGNELLCFNRSAGKQIRVLSANPDSAFHKEDTGRGSNRIAKKIGKLFD